MTEQQRKLIEWQRSLLNEAASLGYRISETEPLPRTVYSDLAFALERLAERVKRELPD
jgi:hypothetical protein